jgi:hypothetical protein
MRRSSPPEARGDRIDAHAAPLTAAATRPETLASHLEAMGDSVGLQLTPTELRQIVAAWRAKLEPDTQALAEQLATERGWAPGVGSVARQLLAAEAPLSPEAYGEAFRAKLAEATRLVEQTGFVSCARINPPVTVGPVPVPCVRPTRQAGQLVPHIFLPAQQPVPFALPSFLLHTAIHEAVPGHALHMTRNPDFFTPPMAKALMRMLAGGGPPVAPSPTDHWRTTVVAEGWATYCEEQMRHHLPGLEERFIAHLTLLRTARIAELALKHADGAVDSATVIAEFETDFGVPREMAAFFADSVAKPDQAAKRIAYLVGLELVTREKQAFLSQRGAASGGAGFSPAEREFHESFMARCF